MPLEESTSEILDVSAGSGPSGIPEMSVADTADSQFHLISDNDDAPPKVLVVDDEKQILRAVTRLLDDHPCELLTAESGEAACEILRQQPVSVIISDERMPGMTGAELLDHVRRHYPNTVRVMLTGNREVSTAIRAINMGEVFRFISKPWDHDEFLQTIEMAIDQHRLRIAKDRYEEHIEAQNTKLRDLNRQLRGLNDELEQRVEKRTRQVRESKQEVDELYAELQESFDGMINALLSIMELGGTHIVQHCQRTAEKVRMFGKQLQMEGEMVRQLERAALLHWIGLINAPESLFQKPIEEFDAEEQATWEFHPLLGQQTIRHVSALNQAGRLILHYLRRYDDPGFQPGQPSSGEGDKPLTDNFIQACQVLAICSFFEQVHTARKPGDDDEEWVQEGLEVLQAGAGERFDPELVAKFRTLVGHQIDPRGGTEMIVDFDSLEPGMVLARPLETAHGIPVAPRDMIITEELLQRLERFRDSKGLGDIHVWR